ncbi:MAG: hypothetical protein CMH64_04595 [Nanoarchaeota archaeon]|nr:hypothetical protein [Nanoarchaeota archaeon]|tara:strand:- start:740 stop:1171 length:432 start_codon:yes stop_codon:yes gene_type:complete
MVKKRHSDDLDFVSNLEKRDLVIVSVLVIASALVMVGLDQTAFTIKENEINEITIFAEKWRFLPNEIKVRQNENVRLKLVTGEEDQEFGFKISRYMYDENIVIKPNEATYYDFKAHTKGDFVFRCEEPCGFGKNLMEGRLVVE